MHSIPYAQFSTEMRSGKIIKVDDGFTNMLGYTEEDVKNGLVFKDFVPDVEYNEIIAELREQGFHVEVDSDNFAEISWSNK